MALIRALNHPATPRLTEADASDSLPLLTDADPVQRRQALRARVADRQSWPAMVARLPQEGDAHVRSVLVSCLVETQSDEAARGFADCLANEDVALRNLAVQALTEMPLPALRVLPEVLGSTDADVRIFATMVLGAIGGPRACELLCFLLEHDGHVNVVDAAINGLAEIGSADHLNALQTARRRFPDDPYIGYAVKTASAALRGAAQDR